MSTILRFPMPRLIVLGATLTFAACGGGGSDPASNGEAESAPKEQQSSPQTGAAGTKSTPTSAGGSAAPSGSTTTTTTTTTGQNTAKAGSGGSGATTQPPASAASAGAGGSQAAAPSSAGAMASTASAGAGGEPAAAGAAAPSGTTGRPAATSFDFAITKEKVTDDPVFNITRPEDLGASESGLPVIVWANGGCFRSDFTWQPLFDRWAKGGFFVLALTGSGDENDIASMLSQTTKTEHAALIDWVVAQNASGPYAGKLDLERIVVAGNSCGGVTALEVAAEEDRLAAVFVLSGSSAVGSVNANVMKAIDIPVGYIVGGSEDIAGGNAAGDYDAMNDGVPAMIVNRREGDHQTVSTDPMIAPEVAEIALNWMDLAVYGTKAAYDALTSMDVCDNCTPGDWMLKQKNIEKLQK